MVNEISLAKDLKENSLLGYYQRPATFELKPGLKIKLPYEDIIYSGPVYQALPLGIPHSIIDSFQASENIFTENVPESWINFIEEAVIKRKEAGLDEDLEFLHALFFTLNENKTRASELGIKVIGFKDEMPSFGNKEEIRKAIDVSINDEILSKHLMKTCENLVADHPDENYEYDEIKNILDSININKDIVVDIACGMGSMTRKYSDNNHLTVGFDRQYHPEWYKEYWNSNDNQVSYIRSDARSIPLDNNSTDVCIMTSACTYFTVNALEKTINEVIRVLKNDGFFIVGPQLKFSQDRWRIFKNQNGKLTQIDRSDI